MYLYQRYYKYCIIFQCLIKPPSICCQPSTKIHQQKVDIFKNESSFDRAKQHNQEVLSKGGHKHNLKLDDGNNKKTQRKSKNILYLMPPFCLLVETKIDS